jgi:hypothetical protein
MAAAAALFFAHAFLPLFQDWACIRDAAKMGAQKALFMMCDVNI